jgi:hypothetical protein
MLSELLVRAQQSYVAPIFTAEVHNALARTEEALDCLDRAFDEHAGFLPRAATGPEWDNLREHPRFHALLQRMKLRELAPRS